MRLLYGLMFAALTIGTLGLTGCGPEEAPTAGEQAADEHVEGEHEHAEGDHDHGEHAGHDHDAGQAEGESVAIEHGGWWCVEHGVPESECALCDTSLVAAFKAKDDWCEEHNRPGTQCFTCDPELFTAFADRYEAKFGEQPPKPTE